MFLRFLDVRTANAQLPVDDRRIVEEDVLLALARAAFADEFERLPGQLLGKFLRVGNRRRRANELRPAP